MHWSITVTCKPGSGLTSTKIPSTGSDSVDTARPPPPPAAAGCESASAEAPPQPGPDGGRRCWKGGREGITVASGCPDRRGCTQLPHWQAQPRWHWPQAAATAAAASGRAAVTQPESGWQARATTVSRAMTASCHCTPPRFASPGPLTRRPGGVCNRASDGARRRRRVLGHRCHRSASHGGPGPPDPGDSRDPTLRLSGPGRP